MRRDDCEGCKKMIRMLEKTLENLMKKKNSKGYLVRRENILNNIERVRIERGDWYNHGKVWYCQTCGFTYPVK